MNDLQAQAWLGLLVVLASSWSDRALAPLGFSTEEGASLRSFARTILERYLEHDDLEELAATIEPEATSLLDRDAMGRMVAVSRWFDDTDNQQRDAFVWTRVLLQDLRRRSAQTLDDPIPLAEDDVRVAEAILERDTARAWEIDQEIDKAKDEWDLELEREHPELDPLAALHAALEAASFDRAWRVLTRDSERSLDLVLQWARRRSIELGIPAENVQLPQQAS